MRRRPLPPPRTPQWQFCHSSPRVIVLGLAVFALVYAATPFGGEGEASPMVVAWLLDDDVGERWVEVYIQMDGAEVALQHVLAVIGDEEVELTHRDWGSWAKSHPVPAGSEVRFEGTLEEGGVIHSPSLTWPT